MSRPLLDSIQIAEKISTNCGISSILKESNNLKIATTSHDRFSIEGFVPCRVTLMTLFFKQVCIVSLWTLTFSPFMPLSDSLGILVTFRRVVVSELNCQPTVHGLQILCEMYNVGYLRYGGLSQSQSGMKTIQFLPFPQEQKKKQKQNRMARVSAKVASTHAK